MILLFPQVAIFLLQFAVVSILKKSHFNNIILQTALKVIIKQHIIVSKGDFMKNIDFNNIMLQKCVESYNKIIYNCFERKFYEKY